LKLLVFVIEDDQHYSPARIAGLAVKTPPVAEGDEHLPPLLFVAFSDGLNNCQRPMVSAKRLHHRLYYLSPLATGKENRNVIKTSKYLTIKLV